MLSKIKESIKALMKSPQKAVLVKGVLVTVAFIALTSITIAQNQAHYTMTGAGPLAGISTNSASTNPPYGG